MLIHLEFLMAKEMFIKELSWKTRFSLEIGRENPVLNLFDFRFLDQKFRKIKRH
jgi:hypothetical protein